MLNEDDALYENGPMPALWKIEIAAAMTGEKAQALADALEDMAISVFLLNREATDGDLWDVHLTVPGKPDDAVLRARLGDLPYTATPVEQKDWLLAVHEDFPPVTIGGFYVYGSHVDGEKPAGLIPLHIDAATAFGSGEHETTQGCMLALEDLKSGHDFKNGLDMGCGSGILAVAMVKLWPQMKLTAVDIDPESTVVTLRHAALNGTLSAVQAETGDGYAAPSVEKNGPFDVIVANILAGPLVAMAGDLEKNLKPGGFCILSGLLRRQMQEVAAAHKARGLVLEGRKELGEWQVLVFRKKDA